jgi:hypothetical protein
MDLNFDLIFVPSWKRFQVSGVRCQDGGAKELNPRMKLYQNGTVS